MTITSEQLQQVRTYFEKKNFRLLMQVMNQAVGPSGQEVQDELEVQIENLKNEATKQFDQERYSECLKSFQFLCEIEPQNRQFSDYLELCRQVLNEKEAIPGSSNLVKAYKNFAEVDSDLQNSTEGKPEAPGPDGVIYDSPSSAVSSLPGVSTLELSRVNTPGIRQKSKWAIRPLKRVVRVSAFVAGILLLFAMLSHWTHRVRAPQLPDHPEVESDPRQFSGREPKGLQNAETKKMDPEARPVESSNSAAQKSPSSGDSTQENLELTEVYPVVHEHRLGSCKGQLHLSSNSIAYLPFENSGDAFKHSPVDIIEIELDHKLKIRFVDRTYRFSANSGGSKRNNQAKLKRIYSQLIKLRRETP